MKLYISPHEKIFFLFSLLYSSIFFFLLEVTLSSQRYLFVLPLVILYACSYFFTAKTLGKSEPRKKATKTALQQSGFYYHFFAYLATNCIGYTWLLLTQRPFIDSLIGLLAWSIGLYIHFWISINPKHKKKH